MERSREAQTELMPRLVVGNTELSCSKLKRGKGFLKPNLGVGPNRIPELNNLLSIRILRKIVLKNISQVFIVMSGYTVIGSNID